ncbi:MAG: FAD-dependent oxidoreductase [Bacteroidota bacterium]
MISLWEKLSLIRKDIVIVGSGITGLSAAAYIKDQHPERKVTIIEQGLLPSGASTKNAGFACFGSLSEIIDDLFTLSEKEVVDLVSMRLDGLKILKSRIGEKMIDYQQNGGYELIGKNDTHYLEKMDYINELLKPVFGTKCFDLADDQIDSFGFDSQSVAHLVYTPFEGQIDTGKMINTLLAYVRSRGVEIITNGKVNDLYDSGEQVELLVNEQLKISANKVLVATNGFVSKLIPTVNINPGRGLVIATKPIDDLKFKGTFHMDKGYYYFRDFNKRLIFGGGRNLDFDTETTTDHGVNQLIMNELKRLMDQVILPGISYEVDITWTGIMGFGQKKSATLEKYSENVAIGVGLGGMGVAIGSIIGEKLAILALDENK